jgi:hypothetical protein
MNAASTPYGLVLVVPAGQVVVQRTICRIRAGNLRHSEDP